MNTDIGQRWTEYCLQISETARRFSKSSSRPSDEITAALNRLIQSDEPTSEAELGIKIGQGDQLQAVLKKAYANSENHETIAVPTQTMAETSRIGAE